MRRGRSSSFTNVGRGCGKCAFCRCPSANTRLFTTCSGKKVSWLAYTILVGRNSRRACNRVTDDTPLTWIPPLPHINRKPVHIPGTIPRPNASNGQSIEPQLRIPEPAGSGFGLYYQFYHLLIGIYSQLPHDLTF